MKVKIKCNKCDHGWGTKSKMAYVSCPSCLSKVKNVEKEATLSNDKEMGSIRGGKSDGK